MTDREDTRVESSFNGSGDDRGLDMAAQTVADALKQIAGREQELKGQLQLVAEERKRLAIALRALEPEHPLVQPTAKSKAKRGAASVEVIRPVWQWIVNARPPQQAFTVRQVADGLGVSDDQVRRAIYALRDAEALRAAGKVQRKGQPAMQFRVMDREAGDRLSANG
jgi:hypothetical protein